MILYKLTKLFSIMKYITIDIRYFLSEYCICLSECLSLSYYLMNLFNCRKHRLVKKVTGLDVQNKLRDLQREEQNMFYLRHSYLTPVSNVILLKI